MRRRPDLRCSGRSIHLWVGLLILLLTALLRLAGFEETPIGADQANILAGAAEIASLRSFPLTGGKSSAGVMFAPLPQYLAALPLLLVRRVVAVRWFFSLLDLLSLAWLYRAVRQAIGFHAAWVSSLLYAANPWIVEFIRWIWQPTLLAASATTVFAALLLLLAPTARRQHGVLVLGLIGATMMGLLHLAALPWAGLCLVLLLFIAWRHRLWRGLWIGAGICVILVLPYLIFLFQTSFADLGLLFRLGTAGRWSLAAFLLAFELVTGAGVLATPRSSLWADSVLWIPFAPAVLLMVLALALAVALLRGIREPERRALLLLAVAWSLLVPSLFLYSRVYLQHFYLLFLFPAPFVLAGSGVESCLTYPKGRLRSVWRGMGWGMAVLLLLLAFWWASLWGVRIYLEKERLLGASTRAWLMDQASAEIQRYLERNPSCQVVIVTYFDDSLSPFDWIRSFARTDRVRVVPAGRGLIIPPDCTCYMLGPQASEADLVPLLDQAVERPDMRIPADPPWRFFCVPPREEVPEAIAEWQNGLGLLRIALEGQPEPGGRIRITYTWHYRANTSRAYHFFNHLLRGESLVAQMDGPGVPTWYWRDNDVLVTSFDLVLPASLEPGEYRLRVGVYGWPDLERVLLLSGEDGYVVERWSIGR